MLSVSCTSGRVCRSCRFVRPEMTKLRDADQLTGLPHLQFEQVTQGLYFLDEAL